MQTAGDIDGDDEECIELPKCEENWRGKNVELKETALNTRRGENSILNPSDFVSRQNVPILANGYTTRAPVTITRQTCAFDSIAQIFAVLYVDNEEVRKRFEPDVSGFAYSLKLIFSDGCNKKTYENRNSLLLRIFDFPVN